MKTHLPSSLILARRGLYEFLSMMYPNVKIDKRAEQFLNLMILQFIDKNVKVLSKIIRNRRGKIFQKKDLIFLMYLEKSKNFPNLQFLGGKIFKQKKIRNQFQRSREERTS